MAYKELEGIFDFGSASDVIDEYLKETPTPEGDELRDLLHFSAADAALIPSMIEPEHFSLPLREPVEVTERDARLAVLSTDCSPFRWDHPRQSPRVWDAGFFAADVSKLSVMSSLKVPGGSAEAEDEMNDSRQMTRLIEVLETKYLQSAAAIDRAYGKSGLVRLRGLLWVARVSVQKRPATASSEIATAVEELGLLTRR